MGTLARSAALLAASISLAPAPSMGQSHLSVAFETGPLFTGVGISAGSYSDGGSVFVGASLGTYYGTRYGIYSDPYDYGYRTPPLRTYVRARSCWDAYWDTYWDPYGGWYDDCVVHGPYAYDSFRARSWRMRWGVWGWHAVYRPYRYVYIRDPYVAPWGPYWAYDPWATYWDGYRDGYFDGRWDRWYAPRPARTVYAYGGRTGVAVYRPSPLARTSTRYKEDPSGSGTRTAVRRTGSVGTMTPSSTRIAQDPSAGGRSPSGRILAPRSGALGSPPATDGARARPASGAGGRVGSSPAGQDRPAARPAAPAGQDRSSARVSPASGDRPSGRILQAPRSTATPETGSRRPSVAPRTDVRSAPSDARSTVPTRPEPSVRAPARGRTTTETRPSAPAASSRGADQAPSSRSRAPAASGPVRSDREQRPSVTRRPSTAPRASSGSAPAPSRQPAARSNPGSSGSSSARPAPSRGSSGSGARPAPSRSPSGSGARAAPSRGSSGSSARPTPSGGSSGSSESGRSASPRRPGGGGA